MKNRIALLLFIGLALGQEYNPETGDDNVQIRLKNGQKAQGEFIGTYMNHVHILMGEKIIYYACDDIISITSTSGGFGYGSEFDYDCSKNTVSADILFPPELDPMTGEWMQMLPDVFNPDISKPGVQKNVSAGVVQNPAVKVTIEDGSGSTGSVEEFVVIDGVKYERIAPEKEAGELIKNQNDTDEREIWNKKISPSLYLEKLSKEKEQRSRFGSYALGYLSLGAGILFLQSSEGPEDQFGGDPTRGFLRVFGSSLILGGLFVASRPFRKSPISDAGKQFEKVRILQDNNERERLAYESLVSLATTSRIKKNKKDNKKRRTRFRNSSPKADLVSILLIGLVAAAIEENKKNNPEQNIQIQLTIEEKALDNFLNQIPIL